MRVDAVGPLFSRIDTLQVEMLARGRWGEELERDRHNLQVMAAQMADAIAEAQGIPLCQVTIAQTHLRMPDPEYGGMADMTRFVATVMVGLD